MLGNGTEYQHALQEDAQPKGPCMNDNISLRTCRLLLSLLFCCLFLARIFVCLLFVFVVFGETCTLTNIS